MAAWLTDEARRLPTGNIIVTYDYDAFGNSVSTSGNTPNEFLYRGEMYDSDLGLYYLRARYMNPLTGRFMSRDPKPGSLVDPKTLHNYLYADGDPVNAIDPSGRGALSEYADSILLIAAYLTQVPAQTYWNAAHAVCDAYETLDLFLKLKTATISAWTGEVPEGPDAGDAGEQPLENFCKAVE